MFLMPPLASTMPSIPGLTSPIDLGTNEAVPGAGRFLPVQDIMATGESEFRKPREVKNHLLFEISTEVANRGMCGDVPRLTRSNKSTNSRRAVGGIYSVIKSKAPVTTAEYGDRYTLIGPLKHESVSPSLQGNRFALAVLTCSRLRSKWKSWNRQIPSSQQPFSP